jgi:UDP-3-O-[3-hydroxymyristoyl] glucosamine N-acyltransferase
LAGSVTVGAGAILGGQVGVADHVTIGERAKIAAKSGVIGDVPSGETWGGYPAQPRLRWLRGIAASYRTSTRGGAA